MPDNDDPFVAPDPSQRPRPGAGRRGMSEATLARATFSRPVEADPLPASAREFLGIGLNPLVQAASALLLLTGQLRTASSPTDVNALRRHTLEEIRRFEDQARAAGVRNEIVLAARYALCAGLDEAVLSTAWGAQSEWAQHPLLVALHREAWGGEKFFEMLDRISGDPARHIDLLELQYLILALGFTGKFQMLERGHDRLADLQQDLYRKIRSQRGPAPAELSLRWRGLEDQRNRLIRYIPWWVVGAAAIAILAVTFTVYYSRLATSAEPLHLKLSQVGMQDFEAPPPLPPVPQKGPTLKQLLEPEVTKGTLTVEESGSRTTVTLRGRDLFASASADLNPTYLETLGQVSAALNRVRGRVVVVGHTDKQPITSFSFRNNVDLSRARAVSVADVLKRSLESPAMVTSNGVGASRPLVEESDAESRSRNRRVEIIHVSGQ
jgi:type VI secretion system protein ImpK